MISHWTLVWVVQPRGVRAPSECIASSCNVRACTWHTGTLVLVAQQRACARIIRVHRAHATCLPLTMLLTHAPHCVAARAEGRKGRRVCRVRLPCSQAPQEAVPRNHCRHCETHCIISDDIVPPCHHAHFIVQHYRRHGLCRGEPHPLASNTLCTAPPTARMVRTSTPSIERL
jgi:hypothetical protein